MMAGDARSDDRDGGRDDITRAVSALEASVASLTKRAEAAETRADQAENRAEQAETRADRAEQALSDAQNRVDRAEMGRDAERSPADELRDRIEALRVQLATAEADGSALTIETAELTAQLNQARRQAQEAQEAAEKKPSGGRGASWRGSGLHGGRNDLAERAGDHPRCHRHLQRRARSRFRPNNWQGRCPYFCSCGSALVP
jgi:chromosome segregation ATPase